MGAMRSDPVIDTSDLDLLYAQAAANVAAVAARAATVTTAAPYGRTTWKIWGSGRPLMLVHGGGGSWSHWIRNAIPLSTHFRVIAPDLPGFGDSQMSSLPGDPAEIAAIVASGLREIAGGTCVDVVGFSFGGVVSGHLAAQHPDLVASLTLVGAVGLGVNRKPAPKMTRIARDMPVPERWPLLAANLKKLMIANDQNIDALAVYLQDINTARTMLRSRPMSAAESLGRCLRELTCPIRAVWGGQDAVYEDDQTERIDLLRGLTPSAIATFIDPAGHWVQFESAEAFNAYLLNELAAGRDTGHGGMVL